MFIFMLTKAIRYMIFKTTQILRLLQNDFMKAVELCYF